jgi:uncharacterized protein
MWLRRLLHSRWATLPLGIVAVLAPVLLVQAALQSLQLPEPFAPVVVLGVAAACALAGYALFVRHAEQRTPDELAGPGKIRELLAGLVLGAGLFVAVVGVLAASGHYRFLGHGALAAFCLPLALAIYSGVVEELLFRGLVFRLIERSWGTWIALVCSAVPFGIIHMVNPHATLAGAVAIIFEAGILLAAAYLLTRRLWLAMGLHAAWNFTQSGVFGIVISGSDIRGWGRSELTGPDWLSGGPFGAEGSMVALVLCTIAGLLLLRAAHARGRFQSYAGQRALARG